MDSIFEMMGPKGGGQGFMESRYDQMLNQRHSEAQTKSLLDTITSSAQKRMFDAEMQPLNVQAKQLNNTNQGLQNDDLGFKNQVQQGVGVDTFVQDKKASVQAKQAENFDKFNKQIPSMVGNLEAMPVEQRSGYMAHAMRNIGFDDQTIKYFQTLPPDKLPQVLGAVRARTINESTPKDTQARYLQDEKLQSGERNVDAKNETAIYIAELRDKFARYSLSQKLKIAGQAAGKDFKGNFQQAVVHYSGLAAKAPKNSKEQAEALFLANTFRVSDLERTIAGKPDQVTVGDRGLVKSSAQDRTPNTSITSPSGSSTNPPTSNSRVLSMKEAREQILGIK